jgi:hypothetical protein
MSNKICNGVLKLFGSVALTVALGACGDDGTAQPIDAPAGPDAPAGCAASDAKTTIADNHVHAPHVLMVTSADVQAGVEKTYDIMGAASHTHMVTLTAADFTALKGGGEVMHDSTAAMGAMHAITVSCK